MPVVSAPAAAASQVHRTGATFGTGRACTKEIISKRDLARMATIRQWYQEKAAFSDSVAGPVHAHAPLHPHAVSRGRAPHSVAARLTISRRDMARMAIIEKWHREKSLHPTKRSLQVPSHAHAPVHPRLVGRGAALRSSAASSNIVTRRDQARLAIVRQWSTMDLGDDDEDDNEGGEPMDVDDAKATDKYNKKIAKMVAAARAHSAARNVATKWLVAWPGHSPHTPTNTNPYMSPAAIATSGRVIAKARTRRH
ncbi:hypothetical protein BG005_002890 [Podila minutissima]|nr:hypothetical protein BG005_002890 [Podila minutissima]